MARSKSRSMSSSPIYVAWMCSTWVSPAAMEFTASFMTATALDTAWRSLRASWLLDQGVMVRSSSMHCFMPDPRASRVSTGFCRL